MEKITSRYLGSMRCEAVHERTGSKLITEGSDERSHFSPTDLVAAALANCILTVMGFTATREGVSIEGASAQVEKTMADRPHRIHSMKLVISMPKGISREKRKRIEAVAHHCPVHKSVSAEIEVPISFVYPD